MVSLPSTPIRWETLDRIPTLDCASPDHTLASCDPTLPPPTEAAGWRKSLEDRRVGDAAYASALASELKALVCSGDDAVYVLRGLVKNGRLTAAGLEAPKLIDDIINVGKGNDCPVSSSLTDADKAALLGIKQEQEAAKKPGG
jgi:hypothetical protein